MAYRSQHESWRSLKWLAAGATVWTSLIAFSMYWNYVSEQEKTIGLATIEARAHFNKDKAFRFWGASHGGVYVPVDEHTPPNPRLADIPERDITTPSGKKLTLMNPAYMLRTMMREFEDLYGVKGKITSFPDKLFYKGNMPDEWELAALNAFRDGGNEEICIADIAGTPYMRLMRPLFIQQDCMKCHAIQGYKIGDLRGAVGVSVSMQPYLEAEQQQLRMLTISHFLLWLTGLFVLFYFHIRFRAQAKAMHSMEEQFHQAQKMEALGTLVGGIAHDFNNMLAGMTGNLYLAKKQLQGHPDALKKLANVEQLSFRAADMIRQLLTFARKDRVSMKPLPLPPFIKETLKFLRTSLPESIAMHQEICDAPLIIQGDATQLHQVLMNLINNARDALEGVDDPHITIRLEKAEVDEQLARQHEDIPSGCYAHLSIEDNGCGIPAVQIEHLFEPFYTTKDQGKGTGLGLSMVFGAVQTHNGYIEVESTQAAGSTFHLFLPLLSTVHPSPSTPHAPAFIAGQGETILLVDDESHILETGKEVLESMGYRVIVAHDGAQAIDLFTINQNLISLIIMDVVMPKLGGVKTMEKIRRIRADVKAIFLTGYDKQISLATSLSESETTTLSKPYDIDELSRIIRQQLDT
ncbi:MAG: histidine kinase [Zetaproteobacteria bacterium CG1_02_53_45]|nr:MAG: histidine kinase [Zetaproteobacteria bacterium CG1_02_53_45]